jgi:predicted nucleotidyltransferase
MRRLAKCLNISEKEKILLLRCRESIHKISPKVKVILYGSRARGDAVPESDYDLLVLLEH